MQVKGTAAYALCGLSDDHGLHPQFGSTQRHAPLRSFDVVCPSAKPLERRGQMDSRPHGARKRRFSEPS